MCDMCHSFIHLVLSSASFALTGVPRVIDGLVCLDEDVSRVKGHHKQPLLNVEALKVHLQIHKLVLLLFAIQTVGGELG